ncbi:peptidoglycan-binding protein [Streptomyces sp. NPDC002734]|uniref:peptidoglycan-binding domain-containing protein n=1 Tax=Streptomyces sp. NPDC002734 TaxID=3154426 RepID=UPI00331E974D
MRLVRLTRLLTRLSRSAQLTLVAVTAAGVAATTVTGLESGGPISTADTQLVAGAHAVQAEAAGAVATLTPDEMIRRAKTWLTANNGGPVPYSMETVWKDGYRQDCSGYVSMTLGLSTPGLNTVGLATTSSVTQRLSSVSQLRMGDLLIDYSTTDGDFRHVVIFEKWADSAHTAYWAYEQRGTYGTTYRQLKYGIGTDNYDPFRPVKLGDSGGSTPTPTPSPTVAWPVLKSGSQGDDVRTAQYLLSAAGYPLTPDGSFGSATQSAVISFQQSTSLTADGIIGANTWSALVPTVKYGSEGDAVKAAQTQLNLYGAGLTVDGAFGSGTQSATIVFQQTHALTADGVIGAQTWRTLLGTR